MKSNKFWALILSLLCVGCLFVACDDKENEPSSSQSPTSQSTPAPTPPSTETEATTLGTPFVSVSGDGIASWSAIENAVGYTYKIDGGEEKNTTALSVALTNGQSIQVKAVGDGVKFKDSAYSAGQTYTDPNAGTQPPAVLAQLATPVVTIDGNGVASWSAIENASGYTYKIDGGEEKNTTARSVTLTNGQSIQVKAVGDGVSFKDSGYSDSKTYTAAVTPPLQDVPEPTYLGILASSAQPSSADAIPNKILPSNRAIRTLRQNNVQNYRSIEEALAEYYQNEDNLLGDEMPAATAYESYSKAGEDVYIQIWLNNPEQYTILSLMLNGVKYQVGGGLQSFFKEENGVKYNCLYVCVKIPSTASEEQTYQVTNIEYVSGTYINPDGTNEFMNENDTVKIGVPYSVTLPSVTNFSAGAPTCSAYSGTFTVNNLSAILAKTGGFARLVVYDNYNVLFHQEITDGSNTFNCMDLVEDSEYSVYIYVYGDMRDGRGVRPYVFQNAWFYTQQNLPYENRQVETYADYDEEINGFIQSITVETTMVSPTAEYVKLEILQPVRDANNIPNWEDLRLVTTISDYDGYAVIDEGLLSAEGYRVRVYYKDIGYPEGRYIEEDVWTQGLDEASIRDVETYPLYDDIVVSFRLGGYDENTPAWRVDSFTAYFYDESSARYIADDVLYLIENPTAPDDLDQELNASGGLYEQYYAACNDYGRQSPEALALMQTIEEKNALRERLEKARDAWQNRYEGRTDTTFWEGEKAKGKYYYQFTYEGTDGEIWRVGQRYYLLLEDYLDIEKDATYLLMSVVGNVDKGAGAGLEAYEFYRQDIRSDSRFYHWVESVTAENIVYDGGNSVSYTLKNEYYSEELAYENMHRGYVYKVTIEPAFIWGSGEIVLYQAENNLTVSEIDWYNEYKSLIKQGQSVDGLVNKYIESYASSYTTNLDNYNFTSPGEYRIVLYTRLYVEQYGDEDSFESRAEYIYLREEKLDKPTISYSNNELLFTVDNYQESTSPVNLTYYLEIKYADGENVTEERFISKNEGVWFDSDRDFQIRVRAVEEENSGWTDSEWSNWYSFSANG